jgi:hypothetical protein
MAAETRPAIPLALPRPGAFTASRDRVLQSFATATTVLTAAIAVVIVAIGAVALGIS